MLSRHPIKPLIRLETHQVWKAMYLYRWKVLLWGILGSLVGLCYGLYLPNLYTSEVKILPELNADEMGEFGKYRTLASLTGIDLSQLNSTEAVRPDLYPHILQSTPFLLAVLHLPVHSQSYSLEQYLTQRKTEQIGYKISQVFRGLIVPKRAIKHQNLLQLTPNQYDGILFLQEKMEVSMDKKTGIIHIAITMPDPEIAAQLVEFAQQYLTQYVTQYRIDKSLRDKQFLEKQQKEAYRRYTKALYQYADFWDKHQALFLWKNKNQGKKLQQEAELAYALYTELSKQLEEARLKVHHQTPVFKVLEPAQVPLQKSSPQRLLWVWSCLFLGLLWGLLYSFIKGLQWSFLGKL